MAAARASRPAASERAHSETPRASPPECPAGRGTPHRGRQRPVHRGAAADRARAAPRWGAFTRGQRVSVARRGTGRTCDVCGAPITRETVEREVDHASESHGFAHEECYRIWREESRRADSPDPTR